MTTTGPDFAVTLTWLRRRRRGDINSRERLYIAVLSILIGAPVALTLVRLLLAQVDHRHAVHYADPQSTSASIVAGMLWYAVVIAVAVRLGPVTVSAPTAAWLASGPAPRRRLLLPATLGLLFAGAAVGGLHAAVSVYAMVPASATAVPMIVLGSAGGLSTVALLIFLQCAPAARRYLRDALPALLIAAGLGISLLGPVGPLAMWAGPWAWPSAGAADGWRSAIAATVIAIIAAAAAIWSLAHLRWVALAHGTRLAGTISAGVVTVDPGVSSRAAEEERTAELSPRWVGFGNRIGGWKTLVAQDVRMWLRMPERSGLGVAGAVVPVVCAQVFGRGVALGVVWSVCGLLAVGLTCLNVRRDRDIQALPRLLRLGSRTLLSARAVLPAVVAAGWSALSLGLVGRQLGQPAWLWAGVGILAGPALAAGAMRAARRGRVRHEFAPIVTPAGLVPTGLLHWLITGVDLGFVLLLPVAGLLSGAWGLATAAIAMAASSGIGLPAFVWAASRGAWKES